MGSSSSFLVGLLNVLNAYENKKISKQNLAYKSIKFEQKILKEKLDLKIKLQLHMVDLTL